jgi:hypothetical protein
VLRLASSVSRIAGIVTTEETTEPESATAKFPLSMKTPIVKTAAAKIATMSAFAMKTASVPSVVGLGSFPPDRSGEGDSNDGGCHQQFPVMERSFIHVRHPISASVGWRMWSDWSALQKPNRRIVGIRRRF